MVTDFINFGRKKKQNSFFTTYKKNHIMKNSKFTKFTMFQQMRCYPLCSDPTISQIWYYPKKHNHDDDKENLRHKIFL